MRAAAELIIANTLERAGVADDFEAYNRRGVELAAEARAQVAADGAVVAAGISNWTWEGEHPPVDTLVRNSADQAAALASGGAELLILEMMIDIGRMRATLDGAMTVGLPMWVGLTCGSWERSPVFSDGNVRLLDGEPLSDAIDALGGYDVDVVAIMHTSIDLVQACLDVALDRWTGPVGVYAHSGDYVDGDWVFDDVMSPAAHRAVAKGWIDRGVRIIGGCCGIGPDHIRALSELR